MLRHRLKTGDLASRSEPNAALKQLTVKHASLCSSSLMIGVWAQVVDAGSIECRRHATSTQTVTARRRSVHESSITAASVFSDVTPMSTTVVTRSRTLLSHGAHLPPTSSRTLLVRNAQTRRRPPISSNVLTMNARRRRSVPTFVKLLTPNINVKFSINWHGICTTTNTRNLLKCTSVQCESCLLAAVVYLFHPHNCQVQASDS